MTDLGTPAAEDQLGLRPLIDLTLPERVIDDSLIPWVPYAEGISVKPLRMNRRTGVWTNLTKVDGGGRLNRHYHIGPVTGFVLEGSWYYEGRDWVARKGMFIWEPPGDVHTLMTGEEGTITQFTLEGALIYVDDQDNVVGFDDCLSFTKTYLDHCRSAGIEPVDLDF